MQEAYRPPWQGEKRLDANTRGQAAHDSYSIFFIVGREKSDPGSDFTDKEEEAAKLYAGMLQAVNPKKLNQMAADGALKEICNDKKANAE